MADETPQISSEKRPLWQWVLIVVALLFVAYGVFYYIGKKTVAPSQTAVSPTVTTAVTTAPSSASPSSATSAVQVTVTGTEFAFTPSVITVTKGQTVQVTFKNAGTFPHNFTIADLGVKSATVQAGQQTTVTFTPDKTGSFTFICSVPGHEARGMKGTLTVK